jgi:Ca2+-transporting ATPase
LKKISEPWSAKEDEVIDSLASSSAVGLTSEEVLERQQLHGFNVLKGENRISLFARFLNQFKSPVILILLFASIVTGVLREYTDSIAILVIVFINAIIGYIQEAKAEEAVEALKKLSAPNAKVLRDGTVKEIQASEVCLGDILILEAGDYIPADARIILASQLSADEAVLTGESLPVNKTTDVMPYNTALGERKNMLFASTAVATGSAKAIVTSIGMQSEIGRIANLLDSARMPTTPLQERLEQVGHKLLYLSGAVVLLVALLGFYHGEKPLDILMTAISLAVAAIPEGLPTVVTVALALAVRRMSKRNAIVRHLPAVETLGSTSVICTDKTGTLTTGKMRVRDVYPVDGKKTELIESAVLCSNATLNEEGVTGDPTEVALLYLARDERIDIKELNLRYPRIFEWSFDSNRKRMSVAVKTENQITIHTKGAPEAILEACILSSDEKTLILKHVQTLSAQGKRLLAFAQRSLESFNPQSYASFETVEKNLKFLGLVAIADPPREETIPAIKACKASGIKIVMITGDHPVTAKAIGKELGIVEEGVFDGVMTGADLDKLSFEELASKVEKVAVYARVSPEHKLKIVGAWQSKGNVVAMTGDGVNDAPALKKASIGVSMGKGGTEVAKQASSMILTDDNFATIVSAVEEGRAIFGNIRRTIQYLLSGNLSEILIMLGAAIAGWPAPLAPIHLLWINLVTDGFPSLALAAEPVPSNVLEGKTPSSKNFFNRHFYKEMFFIGFITAIMALALYGYLLKTSDELTARTYAFSFLVFAELFRSFACRSDEKTFFQMGAFSNIFHLIAVAIPLVFQIWLHHNDTFQSVFKVKHLEWRDCLVMIAVTLIPVTFLEIRKLIKQQRKLRSTP